MSASRIIRGIRDKITGGDSHGRGIKVLGRQSQGDGPVEVLSLDDLLRNVGGGSASIQSLLDGISATRGSVLYRGASAWVALAPGSAGQVLNTNGAGADPTWGSIVAAAAAKIWNFVPVGTSANGQNTSARGNVFTAHSDLSIIALGAFLNGIAAGTYKMGIAPYNTGTNQITSAPTYTNVVTALGGTPESMSFLLAAPYTITRNSTYVVFLVRTDATSTTTMTTLSNTLTAVQASPGLVMSGTTCKVRLASQAPLTSDTWTQAENGQHTFGMCYIAS